MPATPCRTWSKTTGRGRATAPVFIPSRSAEGSIAASAVTVFILVFARRIRSLPWAILFGMLLGGTVGNLTDRLFREPGFGVGHVIDFLQVKYFPAVFNIADTFSVASMGLFIILTIRGVKLDGTRGDAVAAPDHTPKE